MRATLSPEQLAVRDRMGCDAPCPDPQYAITCPSCNGTKTNDDGEHCDECDSGRYRGRKMMHRCPRSHLTPDIVSAMGVLGWVRKGVMPETGGLFDQSASFIAFSEAFEGEISAIRSEMEEERRMKAKRK